MGKKVKQIGIRLEAEEYARLLALQKRVREKWNGHGDLSDIVKELMGLVPPHDLTEAEITAFKVRHGPKVLARG